jgi:putative NIF3 family GTP cyclohydrolase 1 type 2
MSLTVSQIHDLAVQKAILADPRGKAGVARWLKIAQKQHEEAKKIHPDLLPERITNPYMDSRVLFDSGKPVKKVLVGIDISVGEVMLAQHLGDIDLIISHHPEGNALANLDEVMQLQADLLHATAGMPINVAEAIIRKRAKTIQRALHPKNHHQAVDAAKLLNISMISEHTTADNLVWRFVNDLLDKEKPELVGDIIDILKKVPEYKEGIARGEGPTIFAGAPDNRVGKVIGSEFTGGTELGKEIYEPLARVGAGTIVGMHMRDDSREEAEKYHINVVIAGHMSSDSLGMNLFLDELQKKNIEIVPCSGLIRHSRI